MEYMVRNIFLDLDETLIHTSMFGNDNSTVAVDVDGCNYYASVRPGAKLLVNRMKQLGEVYMLTRATREYAIAMINAFDLGIDTNRVFDRKIVGSAGYRKIDVPPGKNFLIDDLPQSQNYEKIAVLKQIGPTKYIQISPYKGFKSQSLEPVEIERIVDTIVSV